MLIFCLLHSFTAQNLTWSSHQPPVRPDCSFQSCPRCDGFYLVTDPHLAVISLCCMCHAELVGLLPWRTFHLQVGVPAAFRCFWVSWSLFLLLFLPSLHFCVNTCSRGRTDGVTQLPTFPSSAPARPWAARGACYSALVLQTGRGVSPSPSVKRFMHLPLWQMKEPAVMSSSTIDLIIVLP